MQPTTLSDFPFRGAIFDMDGTLVDNSPVHVRAFEIFCNRYGVERWREKFETAFGRGNDEIMPLLLPAELIREKGIAALAEEKEAIYREIYAPEIQPVKGLVELLHQLRDAGIRCAVGSSGCRKNIDFVLKRCGITDLFDEIVSGDQVTHCKPEPEIYLTAAAQLGLVPAQCIIFEDARAGFESARRAGAGRLVAIATTLPKEIIVDEQLADVIVDDFSEIDSLDKLR